MHDVQLASVVCDDGYYLRYRVWPAGANPVATLVLVNGMMSHSLWFQPLAQLLTEVGFQVIGADRRGSGPNALQRGDAPSRELLISDLSKVIVKESVGLPAVLVGWCWGAFPVVMAALELGDVISGVVLVAPGLFPSEQVKRVIRETLPDAAGADAGSPVLRSPISEEMFSDRKEIRRFIEQDHLAQRLFTSRFFQISREMSLIVTVRLSELTQPLLLLLAANDQAVDNERTMTALQRVRGTSVTMATLVANHGMQFEVPQEIAMQISSWVQRLGVQRAS